MALKKTIKSVQGVDCTNAHIVVESVTWNKHGTATGRFSFYLNEAAKNESKEPLSRTTFSFELDLSSKKNFIEQSYDFLKTTIDLSGSVDV